ncbi:Low-density lipoprotein receptor domain class A [Desmophyllum pertusum]|uniref:Low-density lipoprotein receptor domain class A n=1 Tax=Desmophyllum pertusum TaxID=174260 RepID=A0A9X0A0I6_9CNID|nr:Low-density lipoprotein receptor domain class A [Desmophyllum pertusum]
MSDVKKHLSYGLCSTDEFQCDAIKCVNISLRCDGEINCNDHSDELHCDVKETQLNTTNMTMSANSTSPPTTPRNLTISPPTPPSNQTRSTKPTLSKKRKGDGYIKKRVYFDNHTKRRKKRPPFYHKIPAWSPNEASTTAWDKTTSEVNIKNGEASPVTHCSVDECVKWKACWRDVTRSRQCACDEAACGRGWKAISTHAGNENDRKLKDVFEWVVISISSTGLLVAIIFLLLKRRRLRQNNDRPLHVRTVVCYHHGQADSACQGGGAENRPLCGKARCPSRLTPRAEGNVCYIDFSGQVKRNR